MTANSSPRSSRDIRRLRSTRRYRRARALYLATKPLCVLCDARGLVVGADELDHIVPVFDVPSQFWDRDNWQPLCRACHEKKTADENRRYSEAIREWQHHVSQYD